MQNHKILTDLNLLQTKEYSVTGANDSQYVYSVGKALSEFLLRKMNEKEGPKASFHSKLLNMLIRLNEIVYRDIGESNHDRHLWLSFYEANVWSCLQWAVDKYVTNLDDGSESSFDTDVDISSEESSDEVDDDKFNKLMKVKPMVRKSQHVSLHKDMHMITQEKRHQELSANFRSGLNKAL